MRGDILEAIRAQAESRRLLSKEHFSVDCTLTGAAASVKGCRPKEETLKHKKRRHGPGGSERRGPGAGRNEDVNFRGERRSNDTHAFTINPDARLAKKTAETGLGAEIHMGGYEGLLQTSERIFNLETLFNRRAGVTGAEHTRPRRVLEEPMPEGPAKGHVCHLAEMLPVYHERRGWDMDGTLTPAEAQELGLSDGLLVNPSRNAQTCEQVADSDLTRQGKRRKGDA